MRVSSSSVIISCTCNVRW